jgi:pimeloyl-ACP methyl ester carboxylesterase
MQCVAARLRGMWAICPRLGVAPIFDSRAQASQAFDRQEQSLSPNMFRESTITTGDVTLNVAEGPAAGPPLVLLHGVSRRWQDWVPLLPTLAARFHVYALDFRGHGNSGRASAYHVVDYVRDAAALLDQIAYEPAIVFGHSLGAMVALAVGAERADRVQALVLEDPPFETLGPQIRNTAYRGMFAAFGQLAGAGRSVGELARELAEVDLAAPGKAQKLRMGDIRDASALRFLASCLNQLDPRTMAPLVEGGWLTGYDLPALLSRVRCPTLLLQGEKSHGSMLGDASAAEVEAALTDCTRVRVEGVGHLIHSLKTEETLRIVGSFLESIQ